MLHALIRAAFGTGRDLARKAKARNVPYRLEPFGKVMLSFGVASSTSALQPSNFEDLVDSRPCAWRELQEREYLAGFFVKLGSTEPHFDRHPERRLSRSDPTPPHTHVQGIPHKSRCALPTNYYVVHGPAQWYETGRLQRNNAIDSLVGPRSRPNRRVWES